MNGEITEELADEVVKHYDVVKIRSVLTCRSPYGVCRKCYGRDLGTGDQVQAVKQLVSLRLNPSVNLVHN